MIRKALLAGAIVAGLIAPASAALADTTAPKAPAHAEALPEDFNPLDYLEDPPSSDTLIMMCMFGWDITIWTGPNGDVHWYSVPGNCPILGNFTVLDI